MVTIFTHKPLPDLSFRIVYRKGVYAIIGRVAGNNVDVLHVTGPDSRKMLSSLTRWLECIHHTKRLP